MFEWNYHGWVKDRLLVNVELFWRSHYWVNPFEYIRVWLNPRSLPGWEFPAFNIPGLPIQGISNLQYTWFTWLGIPSLRYTCFPGQCKSTQILISDLGDTPLIYSALTWHCHHKLLASDKSFLISKFIGDMSSTQFTITTAALILVVPLRADLKSGHYKWHAVILSSIPD